MIGCGIAEELYNSTLEIIALLSFATTLILSLLYAIGKMMNSVRFMVFAKTEFFQLIVSLFSVGIFISAFTSFCSINASSAVSSFLSSNSPFLLSDGTFMEASSHALGKALDYSLKTMITMRHVISAMNVLGGFFETSPLAILEEEDPVARATTYLLFIFGIGGSSHTPYAGAYSIMGPLNALSMSSMVAYFFGLASYFVLRYANSGMIFLFLPLGMIFRSFPFFRKLGGLFISLAFAFFFIYPMILTFLYAPLSNDFLKCSKSIDKYFNGEDEISNSALMDLEWECGWVSGCDESFKKEIILMCAVEDSYPCDTTVVANHFAIGPGCFDPFDGKGMERIITIVSTSLFLSAFIPGLALTVTIAAVRYLALLMGEEIDLSRLLQLV